MSSETEVAVSSALPEERKMKVQARQHCEIVKTFDRLQDLEEDWVRLWEEDHEAEIYQSFAWARAWWNAFGAEVDLCCPVIYQDETVVGILPLVRRRDKLEFLGAPEADYCDVLCEEVRTAEILELCIDTLSRAEMGSKECVLKHIPANSRIARHWRELPTHLTRHMCWSLAERGHMIPLGANGYEILGSLASKQHLRRRRNKLEKAGHLTFRHLTGREEAQKHLALFLSCQVRRRALIGQPSAASDPRFRRLLENLLEELDSESEWRFGVLELDQRPLAWHISFQVNGKIAFYQQTFDVDAWDFAPGDVLLQHFLLYARDQVDREFDFTLGEEPFKSRFATHTREIFTLYIQSRGARGSLRHLWRSIQGRMQRVLLWVGASARSDKSSFELFRSIRKSYIGAQMRLQWARSHGQLSKHILEAIYKSLTATFWQRDEQYLFIADGNESPPAGVVSVAASPSEELFAARFSDLVDFATAHPEVILATDLLEYRTRFREGDRVFLVLGKNGPVLAGWVGKRCAPETQVPALTLYECLAVRSITRSSYEKLLKHLTQVAYSELLELHVCCATTNSILRTELEAQGFKRRYRLIQRRFMHWFRRDSVTDLAEREG